MCLLFNSSHHLQESVESVSATELQDLNLTSNSKHCWCCASHKYKSKWSQLKRANWIHSCAQFKTSIFFRSSSIFLFMDGYASSCMSSKLIKLEKYELGHMPRLFSLFEKFFNYSISGDHIRAMHLKSHFPP